MDSKQAHNLSQALLKVMDTYSTQTCLQVKRGGRYQNITYQRFQAQTFRLVRFFHNHSISNGERVAIAADNSLEWLIAYAACLLAGGVVVPLRTTLPPDKLRFILDETEAKVAILQESNHLQAISSALADDSDGSLPHLSTLLIADHQPNISPSPSISTRWVLRTWPVSSTANQRKSESTP